MPTIINNNFKKFLLFIVLILYSNFVTAGSIDIVSDKGAITLTIVNRPPVITDMHFNPKVAFEDSKLECITSVNDENTDETKLIYKWYVNNELVEASDYYLTGFNENDLVTCETMPIDNENVFGETKSVSVIINERSTLSAITGFITRNYKTNSLNDSINSLPLTLLLSVLLLFFTTIINTNSTLKRYAKN